MKLPQKVQLEIVRILLRAIKPAEKAADGEGSIGIRYFERVNRRKKPDQRKTSIASGELLRQGRPVSEALR